MSEVDDKNSTDGLKLRKRERTRVRGAPVYRGLQKASAGGPVLVVERIEISRLLKKVSKHQADDSRSTPEGWGTTRGLGL